MSDTDATLIAQHLKAWNDVYETRAWGRYPPVFLVRFMARKFGAMEDRSGLRVLEVGCGSGANIWYLAREGFQVAGIDGSSAALALARQRMVEENVPGHETRVELRQGNFAELPWEGGSFDAVIDIEAIYANTMDTIRATLAEVHRVLKPGGRFFGIMFDVKTTGYGSGEEIEPNTFRNPEGGACGGFGISHFFTEEELRSLFSDFSQFELNWATRSDHGQTETVSEWLVSAVK